VRTKALERKFPLARVIIAVLLILALPVALSFSQAGGLGIGIVLSAIVVVFVLGLLVVDLVGGLLMRWFAYLSGNRAATRSEEHTSELQSRFDLVCRLLLEKKNQARFEDADHRDHTAKH